MQTRDLNYDGYSDLLIGSGEDAVVLVPDYHNCTPYAQRTAEGFASDTRVGVVLDLYGDRAVPKTGGEAFERVLPMMDDRALGMKRVQSCVDHLRAEGMKRIVLVGYSCGGAMVIDAVRTGMDVDGVASIWGLLNAMSNKPQAMRPNPEHKVRVLVVQGGRDELAPPDLYASLAAEFSAIDVDWQFHLMGRAKHAFTLREEDNVEVQSGEHPALLLYDADSDRRTARLLQDFLDEVLT